MPGNEALRQIRLAQRSRSRPSRSLSRRELAELVNHYVWDNFHQRTGLDENYIGKLERGIVRWPNDLYRAGLRAVLGVGDDADLGFRPTRGPQSGPSPDDAPAWNVSMAVASASVLDAMTPAAPPGRIGTPEIDQIRGVAQAFSAWDNLYGGLARDAPIALLRWSVGLLRSRACPSELQPDLLSAVALLAHTCGFMAFDSHAFDDARRLLGFGIACAEEADEWPLRARLLATTARLDTWVGEPDRGLTHTQLALVRSDRLSATEQAMLHSLEARALARMRRTEESLAAVERADDAFGHRQADEDPTWLDYYDAAQHAGDTGAALLDLVLAAVAALGTGSVPSGPPSPTPPHTSASIADSYGVIAPDPAPAEAAADATTPDAPDPADVPEHARSTPRPATGDQHTRGDAIALDPPAPAAVDQHARSTTADAAPPPAAADDDARGATDPRQSPAADAGPGTTAPTPPPPAAADTHAPGTTGPRQAPPATADAAHGTTAPAPPHVTGLDEHALGTTFPGQPPLTAVVEAARRRLDQAVDLRRPELARCRALSQIRRAQLAMAIGQPDEAVALAEQALSAAESIRSRRVTDELMRLDGLAERYERHAGVQALRGRLASATLA